MGRVKREKEEEEGGEEVKKRVKVEADVKIEYEEDCGGPENWREVYERVKKMRAEVTAPVDTMGCERLPESVSSKITPKVHRFQLLISLLMSSQTKDEVNAIAMKNLQTELPGGLTVRSVLETPEAELDRLIYKVGFHRRKAKYMKEVAKVLREKYDDDTPQTLKDLIALQGIGPKMAHLFMHRAWNQVAGIGVDVHVHRLANLWKWVKTTNPEDTRKQLEEWLPKELWVDINPMLVGFGQAICKPRYPRCDLCTLSGTGLCPGDKGR
ncbi:hypothetical protein TRICI_001553 [Trichomonascus ciferrii]|uniref:Endonuclease III homolog n=1 Tax=Trichomonascus ciferrii TaxID=44093 RepID=A0A642V8Y9_9ASCO|nr:hypothetical protein TRICI_001553 [Trichomonascus ciferrii]